MVSHQEPQIVFHLLGLAVDSVQDMIYTSQRNCLGHHNKKIFLIEYDQRCQIHKNITADAISLSSKHVTMCSLTANAAEEKHVEKPFLKPDWFMYRILPSIIKYIIWL